MKKIFIFVFMFFIITISSAQAVNYIQDVQVVVDNESVGITVTASEPISYTAGRLNWNKKIYFDFKDTIVREKKTIAVNNNLMTTVRAAQNATKPTYVSRVVLDMLDMQDYTATLSEDKKSLYILFGAPISPIEKKIIVLDPGHGGKDPGAIFGELYEKTLNLDIAKRVQALLIKDERFDVYMTRETDVFVELLDRAKFANDKQADLFVCIHNNSMPAGFSGTMLLYNASKLAENKDIADTFQSIVQKASGLKGIGARSREDLVVLKNIEVPGVLVEVACMSNLKDRRELRKDSFKQTIAQAIYESIIKVSL